MREAFRRAAFSSEKSDWETPPWLVDYLAEVFSWDLDVCASRGNVCDRYYAAEDNGLEQDWSGLCWMNPPYGRGVIGKWMAKARATGVSGDGTVVCLVPGRTAARWWQDHAPDASMIVFIRGRVKFVGATSGAPFPSVIMVFGELSDAQRAHLAALGWSSEGGCHA